MKLCVAFCVIVITCCSSALALQDGRGRTEAPKAGSKIIPKPVSRPTNSPPVFYHRLTKKAKPAPGSPQAKAENFLSRGKAYYDDFENDPAIDAFSKSIEFNPKFAEAYYNRALTYRRKGDTDTAIADYSSAIEYDPEYTEAYFNRADAYISKLNFDAAISDLTAAINLHPNGIAVIFTDKGTSYVNKMDIDPSVVIQKNGLARILTLRGGVFYLIGDMAAAMNDLDRAIVADPEYAGAYTRRGRTYLELKNFDAAIRDCEKALEIEVTSGAAQKCRTEASDAKAKFMARIIELSNPVRETPDDHTGYFYRGNVYLEYRDLENAIADYDRALELNPKSAFAFSNRGMAYFHKGDFDRAIQDQTSAIALNPAFADAIAKRGLAFQAKGDIDAAIAEFSKAIDANAKFGDAYLKRGQAYILKGDMEAALSDLTKYIEVFNSGNSDTYRIRSTVYDKMGKADLADADRKIAKQKKAN